MKEETKESESTIYKLTKVNTKQVCLNELSFTANTETAESFIQVQETFFFPFRKLPDPLN